MKKTGVVYNNFFHDCIYEIPDNIGKTFVFTRRNVVEEFISVNMLNVKCTFLKTRDMLKLVIR